MYDWNRDGKHDARDHLEYQNMTNNDDSSSGGGGHNSSPGFYVNGFAKFIAGVVVVMLIYFVFSGASWDAIECLLGLGLLAFIFFRWLFN